MKKLFALTMAGICAIAFAAVADAASTLRMKAPTVKTATRTASNIVGQGKVDVKYVYCDWTTCATDYKANAGGKYDVTSLNLSNLLTSQQVYDDLREKFLTTEFDYTRKAYNGNSYETSKTQSIGLLSTLVPSVADETILTSVITVGKAYNGQKAGNNYYDFQSKTDKDGMFSYSDLSKIGDVNSGMQSNYVIPGRVSSLSGSVSTTAADLAAAIESNNGKSFTKEEAAKKTAELENLFYVSEKTAWDNQQEANKISVKNLVSQLQSRYDSFTNAQADERSKTQAALNAIVAGLNNGSMTYEEALAKLQDIINGISNFDKAGYNNLLNNYASQLASLKSSFESNYAGTELALAKELQALKDSNATAYANAEAKAESDKQELQNTMLMAINIANSNRQSNIKKAGNAVNAYYSAEATYSTLLENYSDEKDVIKDNYASQIDQLESARQDLQDEYEQVNADRYEQLASLKSARDAEIASLESQKASDLANLQIAEKNLFEALNAEKSANSSNPDWDYTTSSNYTSLQNVKSLIASIDSRYNDKFASVESNYQSQVDSVDKSCGQKCGAITYQINSINSQISAVESARDAELAAVHEKYEGTNGLLTQAQADIDSAKAACDGDPSTYVAKVTEKANSAYDESATAAKNDYQSGVNSIDSELAALKSSQNKAELDKASSNEAALKAIEDKYAANKLALEKKAEAALASFVLDQFVAMQNADNAKMLAELKAELTSFINGLTDSKGNAYSTANISNYDSLQFNEVSYNSIAYNKNYSAADYAAEKAKGTFDVDISEEVEVNVKDNEFLSALNVSSTSKVTMVDGVLQEVTTNTESLYKTTIYIEAQRKCVSPIVLDIKGDGVLQASDGQHFPGHAYVKNNNIVADFYGDGFEIAMEWVGPQDGLLVAPKADGSVDMSCLFGIAGGYESGYEKLSLYDKNGDDKVSGEELNGLSVWQDANSNGIADEGEVKTVQELGITSLGITNSLDFTSTFERNGQSYKMWDWWPNAVELIKVAAK